MIDRLRQMAIFSKTIDHGSFRGAAKELRLSPSVVSHHISELEDHLGVALIYRSTRKLTLSREGERLLAATHKMLEAVEGELLDLTSSAAEPSGELSLTVPSVLSQSVFTEKVARFLQAYPRIQMSLDFSDTRRELIGGGFDFAIRMGPKLKTSAQSRTLFKVRRQLVAASDYVASQKPATTLKDLLEWDWLALSPVQNIPLTFKTSQQKSVTLRPSPRTFTNDAQGLYRLSRAGAGLAVVPDFLAEQDISDGRMVHVFKDWELPSIDVFAVWPANAPKHGLIHLAINALMD